MREEATLDLIFVSDLHLGANASHETAPYLRAFAPFLDHLRGAASAEGRACRLVLLGDALDFVELRRRAGVNPNRLDTSTRLSIGLLDEIARQEPLFFSALGRFASDLAVDVVPGNHDIDLVQPAVQHHFRDLVERASNCWGAGSHIAFHPWIYHVPGLVYAEHGHQHHDINSFTTLLQPYVGDDEERLDLPLGAYLGTSEATSSTRAALAKARSGMSVLRCVPTLLDPRRAERRVEYRDKVLRPYATEVGLDAPTVTALDRLCETSPASIAARLLRKAFRHRAGGERPTQQGGYLHRAAVATHRTLGSSSPPYYVFGHTHVAERFPLLSEASSPQYLNSGTWSPNLPRRIAPGDGSPLLTCVRVRGGSAATPVAEALRWDDAVGNLRPLDATLSANEW